MFTKTFDAARTWLTARRQYVLAALLMSIKDFLAAVGAGFIAHKLVAAAAGDTVLMILRVLVFVVLAVYWALKFYENYQSVKAEAKTNWSVH